MIPDKVLYTDGHNVVVTDSVLKVKNTSYKINGIIKHALFTMPAERWPGLIILMLGLAFGAIGLLQLVPAGLINNFWLGNLLVTPNNLALAISIILFVLGLIVMALMSKRYAVRIATAEGEKNVIVSRHREYVQQIVNALNEAFSFRKHNYL